MDRDRGDGRSMAGHVQAAGHELYVHNRTKAKAEELLEKGLSGAILPRTRRQNPKSFSPLSGFRVMWRKPTWERNGVLSTKGSCRIIVDMTTSRPSLAQILGTSAAKKGDGKPGCPVSGGDIGARDATLAIMVGARKKFLTKSSLFSS